MPIITAGYALHKSDGQLVPHKYQHRDLRADDVHIKVHYCGVCHSDIHLAREEWTGPGTVDFPLVCGHEIVGLVEAMGPKATKYKVGDKVGVGCLVGSCLSCGQCKAKREQHCKHAVETYGSRDPIDNIPTAGGYGRDIIVPEHFVLRIPENLEFKDTAPLLCAGITAYSPMKRWGAEKGGMKIGVLGLGGLGHMAVKFGKAWKNEVVVISRSMKKEQVAKELGADHFLISTSAEDMAKHKGTLDLILDTVSAEKDMLPFLELLMDGGIHACVGMPKKGSMHAIPTDTLTYRNLTISGSCIGGIAEHQEVLDFCGKFNVNSTNEHIPFTKVNEAWDRVLKSDVQFRFVLDVIGSCPKPEDL